MSMSITSTSELELSLISFAGSDSTLTWQGVDKRKGRRPEGWGWGRFFKGGDYFKYFRLKGLIILREAFNLWMAIIQGMWYPFPLLQD